MRKRRTYLRCIIATTGLWLVLAGFVPGSIVAQAEPASATSTNDRVAKELEHIRALIDRDRFAEADSLAGALLADVEKTHGPEALEAAKVLDLIVEARWRGALERGAEPRRLAERAVEIRESLLGPEHGDLVLPLLNLAATLSYAGDYEGAIEVLDRGIEIGETALGPDPPDLAKILIYKGRLLSGGDVPAEARPYYERALAIQEKVLGPEHIDTIRTVRWYAYYHLNVGEYQTAGEMSRRAVELHEKIFPPNSLDLAHALNDRGVILEYLGDYEEALGFYVRTLEIRREVLGPEHLDVGYINYNIGRLKNWLGDVDDARMHYEAGLSILEKVYGQEHGDVAYGYGNLGKIQHLRGDYRSARSLLEKSAAIYERAVGPDNPNTVVTHQILASILVSMGEYAEARTILERCLSALEEKLGPDAHRVAACQTTLAQLLSRVGDNHGSRSYLQRALATYEKVLGPEHAETGYAHNELGWALYRLGETELAREAFTRALAIHEQALDPEHRAVAEDLTSLGVVVGSAGEYEEAATYLERSLAIMEKLDEGYGPGTALCLRNLAVLRRDAGDPAGADTLFTRAIPMIEDIYGRDNPSLARVLYHYGVLLAETGRWSEALAVAMRTEDISREHLRVTSRRFAEMEGLRYAASRVSGLDLALSLAVDSGEPSSTRDAWDALIRSRALVLDEVASRNRAVADISRLAQDLVSANDRLADLMVRGPGDESRERYDRMVEEARRNKDLAERMLAERSSGFRDGQKRAKATLRDVAAELPRKSAIVSFIRYDRHASDAAFARVPGPRPDVEPWYLALVQRKDEFDPVAVDLGPAEEIEILISRWRDEFDPNRVGPEVIYRTVGAGLRRIIWDPVAAHSDGIDQVFIVPDGALNLVSFSVLPVGEDAYVLETGPTIHYLSAERDLLPPETSPMSGEGLLAVGGPDYGVVTGVAVLASAQGTEQPVTTFRGQRSGCADFAAMSFTHLTGAAAETDEIASIWMQSSRVGDVIHMSGAEASEGVVKTQASGKRVLHLATHGFFLGNCASALDADPGYHGLQPAGHQPPTVRGENPLVLSGLALAGANQRASAGMDVEDGILTAQEIGSLDLSSVELAVLSACDTGVGEVRAGEGVFGLRRAFQVAGARTLVMSLWSVDDTSTREWMRAFYGGWLRDDLSKSEAVRAASLAVLKERRARGESSHPFYWGAFVAAGGWR